MTGARPPICATEDHAEITRCWEALGNPAGPPFKSVHERILELRAALAQCREERERQDDQVACAPHHRDGGVYCETHGVRMDSPTPTCLPGLRHYWTKKGADAATAALAAARAWAKAIVDLSAGWDADGSTGPRVPLSWESVGRVALDYARALLASEAPGQREEGT